MTIHRNVTACSFSPLHTCISPYGNCGDYRPRLQSPWVLSSSTAHAQNPRPADTRTLVTQGLMMWLLPGCHHHPPAQPDGPHRRGQGPVPGCRARRISPVTPLTNQSSTPATTVLQKNWCCLMQSF